MEENLIQVYAKLDSNNVIININSSIFLHDTTGYTQIDEGNGDKYSHAQGNYLEKGLIDSYGKNNYKLIDGKPVELTNEEKVILFPTISPQPSEQDTINSQLLMENADMKTQLQSQQELNAQLLLDIAILKGGSTNV